jgi:hypothetical protein
VPYFVRVLRKSGVKVDSEYLPKPTPFVGNLMVRLGDEDVMVVITGGGTEKPKARGEQVVDRVEAREL